VSAAGEYCSRLAGFWLAAHPRDRLKWSASRNRLFAAMAISFATIVMVLLAVTVLQTAARIEVMNIWLVLPEPGLMNRQAGPSNLTDICCQAPGLVREKELRGNF
jgi:hypothetical protein